jgi:hypothetical protein
MPNRARAVGGAVLVFQRVEAMRIGGDHLVEMRFCERSQIFVAQSLKQPVFARQAGIVSGVALAFVENPKVETGSVKNARRRASRVCHARIVRGIVAHEPQVLDRLLAGVLDGKVQFLGPPRTEPRNRSERISVAGQALQRFLERFVHVPDRTSTCRAKSAKGVLGISDSASNRVRRFPLTGVLSKRITRITPFCLFINKYSTIPGMRRHLQQPEDFVVYRQNNTLLSFNGSFCPGYEALYNSSRNSRSLYRRSRKPAPRSSFNRSSRKRFPPTYASSGR